MFVFGRVSQTEIEWTLLFLRLRAFRKSKMVVCQGKWKPGQNGKLNGFVWFLSGWRKWFPKPFPRQHDPKLNLVRGRSRRVWETRSRVFRGVDEGSKSHRFGYRNGGDWQCRNVPPSVIFVGQTMKTSGRNKTVWTHHIKFNALYQIIRWRHSS